MSKAPNICPIEDFVEQHRFMVDTCFMPDCTIVVRFTITEMLRKDPLPVSVLKQVTLRQLDDNDALTAQRILLAKIHVLVQTLREISRAVNGALGELNTLVPDLMVIGDYTLILETLLKEVRMTAEFRQRWEKFLTFLRHSAGDFS